MSNLSLSPHCTVHKVIWPPKLELMRVPMDSTHSAWRRCIKLPAQLADTDHFYRQTLPGLLVELPGVRQEKAPSKWG
ncbi:hypothetical protein [Shewanella amazonensis]|uniref:hypothetical protein n=1 Tax=Shewanella amazonensis TaxID=60478 RepID=UPI0012F7A484|nr:hypothetical protein [Shewanella amazonensis]